MNYVTTCIKFIIMLLNNLEILAVIFVGIGILKISALCFSRNTFDSFIENYKKSINNYPWFYFIVYLLISIGCLVLIRSANISYTIIISITMFVTFLINAGLISTTIIENYDLKNINWKMMGIYTFIWLFIMFKAIQEIIKF